MHDRRERGTVGRVPVGIASILGLLLAGCEGDIPVRLMQRDLDSVRSEVAAVSRMSEGDKAYLEDRLGKIEADLKSRLEKAGQERREDIEGFMRSQASLNTKLDELAEQARLTQGRVEEIGHRIVELSKRLDPIGGQVGQVGRRLDGVERQVTQAAAAAQEAKAIGQTATTAAQDATAIAQQAATASQQTAQDVTDALRQMAEQTNAALQQVNTSTQLALTEARKAGAAQPTGQPTAQQAPAVVKLPPPISVSPSTTVAALPPHSTVPARPPISAATPDELYKNALNDYTRGKYDLAIDGFRAYIIQYPNTSLLPNAHYWLAESFYSVKNYGLAIKQFDRFLTEYPDNPKVPGAILKQGYAYLEGGNNSQGRTVLNDLIKRFPKSPEAKSAKNRLSKLKKSSGTGSGAKSTSKKRAP
jgi:tol-pal system protein YbgF